MRFDGSSVVERYFFDLSEDFLEIDVLEMDGALKYALRDVPDGGTVALYVDGANRKAAGRKTVPRQHVLQCTVDHTQGVLTGDGLGAVTWSPIVCPLCKETTDQLQRGVTDWHCGCGG